jgi:hypothetical protein
MERDISSKKRSSSQKKKRQKKDNKKKKEEERKTVGLTHNIAVAKQTACSPPFC